MDHPKIKHHWAKSRDKKGRKADMHHDWTKLAAKAIPKEGFFEEEQGRYGPTFPRTPACYGFTIIAKIKPGTEQTIRGYGKKIEETIAGLPDRGLHEAGRDPGSLHRHPPSDPITILRLMKAWWAESKPGSGRRVPGGPFPSPETLDAGSEVEDSWNLITGTLAKEV